VDVQLTFLWLLAERLSPASIRYMVAGPLAASLYGPPVMARTVDVVVELAAPAVDRFVELFSEDCVLDRDAVAQAVSQGGSFSVVHVDWIVKADFLVAERSGGASGLDRRRWLEVASYPIAVAAAEDVAEAQPEAPDAPSGAGAGSRAVSGGDRASDDDRRRKAIAAGEAERRRRSLQRSPVERLTTACRMFTTAQKLLRARIAATDEAEVRRELFLRLYGNEIEDADFRERAAAEIAARPASSM